VVVLFGDFEWESSKAASNVVDHGISFPEAIPALTDPLAIEESNAISGRVTTIGFSELHGALYVVTTESNVRTRIISARKAEPQEARRYHEGK